MLTMCLERFMLIVDNVDAQSSFPVPGQCTQSLAAVSVSYSWFTVAFFPRKLTSGNESHYCPIEYTLPPQKTPQAMTILFWGTESQLSGLLDSN